MALTVLYDPSCGLCRRVHDWLTDLPKLVETGARADQVG